MIKKMDEKNLGFKLRKIRESKDVSQQMLAIDLGIPQSKVSKIENGTEKITLSYFLKVSNYFSLSPDEMFELLNLKPQDQDIK